MIIGGAFLWLTDINEKKKFLIISKSMIAFIHSSNSFVRCNDRKQRWNVINPYFKKVYNSVVNILHAQISIIQENLSNISASVMLHEWTDDEKIMFS